MFVRAGAVVAALSFAVAVPVQRDAAGPASPVPRYTESAVGVNGAAPMSGGDLVVRHRCGVCHADLPQPRVAEPSGPLSVSRVVAVLRDSPGDHPDFRLSEAEAFAIALGVTGVAGASDPDANRLRRRFPQVTPELGRRFAASLNCGGCHGGLPRSDAAGPVLAGVIAGTRPDWLRSFLRAPHAVRPFGVRPGSGSRMPDFRLDDAAADSIFEWLVARAGGATVPAAAGAGSAEPLPHRAAVRADALLDLLSCRGCHSYGGRGGRIGPALDDVHRRRTAEYIAAVVTDPAGTVPGAGMPAIDDGRVGAVIELLARGPRDAAAARAAAGPSWLSPLEHPLLPADGSPYVRWCAACHGEAGRGDGFNARYLDTAPIAHTDASFVGERADDTLFDGIAAGGLAMGASPEMPPFGSLLDAVAVRDIIGHLRALCDCPAPAWSAGGRR